MSATSHTSAERVVLPDSFLAVDYMLDRFTWLVEGLVVHADRMRENLDTSRGLVFSQRLLLALVESGLGRDDAYRRVQRHALRAWDEDSTSANWPAAITNPSARVDLDEVFDPTAFTRHVDTVFERLRALVATREEAVSVPDAAAHVGSGKVRELYALGDERLLLVASDRISVFDVVLPTPIPDKRPRPSRLSAYWFARTAICANHSLELRPDGRSLECRRLQMLPVELVVRGYLAGSGWNDYARPARSAATGSRPACAKRIVCPRPFSLPRRRQRAATTRTSPSRRPPSSSARTSTKRRVSSRSRSTPSAPRTPSSEGSSRRHQVRNRPRRRGRARARRRSADARLVALLAGRRLRTGRPATLLRQAVRARLV